MPSLVLFNQHTLFSGDDLRLYAVGSISIRIVELCVACVLLYVVLQQEDYELEKSVLTLLQDDDEKLHHGGGPCAMRRKRRLNPILTHLYHSHRYQNH